MADNVNARLVDGIASIRAGELQDSTKVPFVKMDSGVDGSQLPLSSSNPLPFKDSLAMARGLVPGITVNHKFGSRASIAFSPSVSDIWSFGTEDIYRWPRQAGILYVSSSGNDSVNDTGARVIRVEGLDANFAAITEDIALTSTFVAAQQEFIRVNRAYATDVGTYGGANENAITLSIFSDRFSTVAYILPGDGQTEQAIYTVPAGKTAYLSNIMIHSSGTYQQVGTEYLDLRLLTRENADDTTAPYSPVRVKKSWSRINGSFNVEPSFLTSHPAKSDIWFRGASVGPSNSNASVHFDLFLVDD